LEVMPVHMHRVAHAGRDGEGDSDTFTAPDIEGVAIG
jgi:hypothetical protein